MSRAFTREIDDAPPPPPAERTMSSAPNLVTPRGARLIGEAIAGIEAEIEGASGERLAGLQRDLRYWSARQAVMQVVPPSAAAAVVGFGSRVRLKRRGRTTTLTIVGEDEADPAAGRIAWTSPLAAAIEGAEPGESVPFEAGGQEEEIVVVGIEASHDA